MSRKTYQYIVLIGFILFSFSTRAQKLRFNHFELDDGLCQSFIYTINEDKNGYILFGTGEGICRYDGYTFERIGETDTITHDVVSASYNDKFGNVWYGFNNSSVVVWDGVDFSTINEKSNSVGTITGFSQLDNGNVLIASQRGDLFVYNGKDLLKNTTKITQSSLSSFLIDKSTLFAGSVEGLSVSRIDENGVVTEGKQIEDLAYLNIQTIEKTQWEDCYIIGTEGDGIFFVKYKNEVAEVKKIGVEDGLDYINVQDIIFTSKGNLWLSTFNDHLINLESFDSTGNYLKKKVYDDSDGVAGDYLKVMYTDIEGNFWVGTYGNGFSVLKGRAFSFIPLNEVSDENNITAIDGDESTTWFAKKGDIISYNKTNGAYNLLSKKITLPNDAINALHYDDGILWIGFNENGVFRLDVKKQSLTHFFKKSNSLANSINHIISDEENIYLATKNGIYIITKATKEEINFTTYDGLTHNDIEYLLLDDEGRLLFATRNSGISGVNILNEIVDYVKIGKYEIEFNSLTKDHNGNIWAGTSGEGVFHMITDTLVNITTNNGLKSNYCYGIVYSDSNYVWVGHRMGLSRISIYDYSVKVFDQNIGVDGNINLNAYFIDDNKLYFGTTNGILEYDIQAGKKQMPAPRANIQHVLVSDKEYDFEEPIDLPYDIYKLRIDFVGLNYNNPEEVKYQYKLDGYDLDWSEMSDMRQVNYPRVEDGSYTFLLRAYSNNGLTEESPVSFTIKVSAPIWKRWWFISLITILLIGAVILIIQYREHKQKQIQEYLEQRLDERTREVVEQKEEIEIKNRDITDSINYAQRIQTSILPSIKKLQNAFSGSFVFYQPRDIVSGDFYWFDKIGENKFIIVCADSTGHGVPGAFMSMIGTTLLKDICMRKDISSPSEILRELDFELRNTLNQDSEESGEEQSNDGMDIIVCEIDVSTCYLRYSSAMRPMIVYRNGEQVYLKGSRTSVGGHYEKELKNFKDEGVQLSKGDLVYMFSDGYPDQFGGPLKKKFKMVRLKNLLKDINKKPMEEQYEYVKSTFNLWKEDLPQVDDVLFMGIKI